jgi:hypothetical protein
MPATATPVSQTALAARKCGVTSFASAAGDFRFSTIDQAPLLYLGNELPPDIPTSQPYQVPANYNPHASTPAPRPKQNMGYDITVCNSGAHALTLSSVGLKALSFQPATGSKQDIENGCDSPYPNPSGGCGGATAQAFNDFEVTWPATIAVGVTTASAQQTSAESTADDSLNRTQIWDAAPITLAPGQGYNIHIYTPQIPSGVYTFAIGVQTEVGTVYSGNATFPIFFAPDAQVWSGFTCFNNTAMQALMQPGKSYLCPDNR